MVQALLSFLMPLLEQLALREVKYDLLELVRKAFGAKRSFRLAGLGHAKS